MARDLDKLLREWQLVAVAPAAAVVGVEVVVEAVAAVAPAAQAASAQVGCKCLLVSKYKT